MAVHAPRLARASTTEDVIWDRGTPTCAVMMRNVGLDIDRLPRLVVPDPERRLPDAGRRQLLRRHLLHRPGHGGAPQAPGRPQPVSAVPRPVRLAESTRNLYLASAPSARPIDGALSNPKLAGVSGKLALAELADRRIGPAVRHAAEAVAFAVTAPGELVRQRHRMVGPAGGDASPTPARPQRGTTSGSMAFSPTVPSANERTASSETSSPCAHSHVGPRHVGAGEVGERVVAAEAGVDVEHRDRRRRRRTRRRRVRRRARAPRRVARPAAASAVVVDDLGDVRLAGPHRQLAVGEHGAEPTARGR